MSDKLQSSENHVVTITCPNCSTQLDVPITTEAVVSLEVGCGQTAGADVTEHQGPHGQP